MNNIVAGIGRGQLEVLDERVEARRHKFKRYEAVFESVKGIHFQPELKDMYSNRWLTTLAIDPEEIGVTPIEIIEKLAEANIDAQPVWKPMHLQSLFENRLCLPSGANMTDARQDRVIEIIKALLDK